MNARERSTAVVPGAPRPDGRYDLAAAASSESSSAPPVVGPLGIAVEGSGRLTYAGLPVSMASDGTPRVHVSAGEMTIDTLKSLNVDLEYERVLYASRARMGAA